MLLLSDYRAYIQSIYDRIPEFQKQQVVMDDSQITKFVDDCTSNSKCILLGIVPKHKPSGNLSNLKIGDYFTILVLYKVDRSRQTHDMFLDALSETQLVAKKVFDLLFSDHMDTDNCNILNYLEVGSLDINPIWKVSSCDGYQIDLKLNTLV